MTQPPARDRILVIEDDPGKLYTLCRQLRAAGFETWEATTATDGLARVQDLPDLVVLDLKLPDLSGFEVCRRIKADPVTRAVLVLELSARYTTSSDRTRGLDEGADGYLVHPVDAYELIATVRALLRLRTAERERARLTAEAELRESRHRTVTDTATVGLCLVDDAGRCTFANPAASAITGYPPDALEGASLEDRLLGARTTGAALLTAAEPVREHRELIRRADDTWIPVRLSSSPIVDADRYLGAVVEIKDDRQLARAEQARELFLATLGHDLRNPLQTVALGCQLLDQAGLDAKRQEIVGRMQTSITRMQRLVDQTLILAQSLVEGVPVHPHEVDLGALCDGVIRDLRIQHGDHRIARRGAATVIGTWDPDRLTQVVDNLLGNALRHGEGVVTLAIDDHPDDVDVSVHNRGAPIPPEAVATLFQPFRRAASTRGGLGLGLYIVDQIVRAHGGSIDVSSSAEHGTTFRVRLPRAARAATD
jgi:phosphoserine phosphatase RsbU/P